MKQATTKTLTTSMPIEIKLQLASRVLFPGDELECTIEVCNRAPQLDTKPLSKSDADPFESVGNSGNSSNSSSWSLLSLFSLGSSSAQSSEPTVPVFGVENLQLLSLRVVGRYIADTSWITLPADQNAVAVQPDGSRCVIFNHGVVLLTVFFFFFCKNIASTIML